MNTVLIVDYGMGNLRSVANAFEAIGSVPVISSDPGDLVAADRIVLPGVGAFVDGMTNLQAGGWIDPLREQVLDGGKPFLGICLGMQLLATAGTEGRPCSGLGWVNGMVTRLEAPDTSIRIPHIGWNEVSFKNVSPMYAGLGDMQTFYFVHSYVLTCDDVAILTGECDHGQSFCASIVRDNIWAVQFHPEKSHKPGLGLLRNFMQANPTRTAPSRQAESSMSGVS